MIGTDVEDIRKDIADLKEEIIGLQQRNAELEANQRPNKRKSSASSRPINHKCSVSIAMINISLNYYNICVRFW